MQHTKRIWVGAFLSKAGVALDAFLLLELFFCADFTSWEDLGATLWSESESELDSSESSELDDSVDDELSEELLELLDVVHGTDLWLSVWSVFFKTNSSPLKKKRFYFHGTQVVKIQ